MLKLANGGRLICKPPTLGLSARLDGGYDRSLLRTTQYVLHRRQRAFSQGEASSSSASWGKSHHHTNSAEHQLGSKFLVFFPLTTVQRCRDAHFHARLNCLRPRLTDPALCMLQHPCNAILAQRYRHYISPILSITFTTEIPRGFALHP